MEIILLTIYAIVFLACLSIYGAYVCVEDLITCPGTTGRWWHLYQVSLNAKKLMLLKMFFRLILLFYIYAILPACIYAYNMHAWCLRRSEDGVRSLH